jgi:hypothetical protein
LVAAAVLLILFHLVYRSPAFPFTSDSSRYIDEARSLLQYGFPTITPPRLELANVSRIPTPLFPPGLPLMLAALGVLGVEPKWGAIAIGWAASLLLPFAIYWACHRRMASWHAAGAAFLGSLSIGVVVNSGLGLTDIPALLLSVLVVGILFNYATPSSAAIAGILAALSYVMRNQQAALLIALAIYFAFVFINRERDAGRRILAFGIGAASVILPYFLWNLEVFGTPTPYKMSPSTVSFSENALLYLFTFLHDVTATWTIPMLLTTSAAGLAMLALVTGLLAVLFAHLWRSSNSRAREVALLCFVYVALGSAIVVIARTRYQWGEFIGIRHVLPYAPFIFIGIFALLDRSNHARALQRPWRYSTYAIAAFLVCVGLMEMKQFFRNPPVQSTSEIAALDQGRVFLCPSSNNFLISNWAHVFRIDCAAPVRFSGYFNVGRDPTQFDIRTTPETYDIATGIELMMPKLPAGRRSLVAIFPRGAGVESSDLPLSAADAKKLTLLGWVILANDPAKLVVSHDKPMRGADVPASGSQMTQAP